MMLLHRIALVVVLLLSLLPAQEGVASGSVVAVDKDYNTTMIGPTAIVPPSAIQTKTLMMQQPAIVVHPRHVLRI